jgi:glycosyltransferase involved in cell wall biosynthesis
VILPAYNEGVQIYANLRRVCETLHSHAYEVVVVDDGSADATFAESERAARDGLPVRVVRHPANRGKGAALITGFGVAAGELVAFLDADLEIAPEHLLHLWEQMQATGAEVVVGTKQPGANRFPPARRALSALYRRLVAVLFGLSLSDTQTGIKLFKRTVLETSVPRLGASRFAFDIELLVAATRFGYRIAECPVTTDYRRAGGLGRMRLGHLARLLADTLVIWYRASFWRWLQPSWSTRFWMVAFVAGILLLGVGLGKLITPLILESPVRQIFYVVALQFLPRALRDWLLVIGGGGLTVAALIQLNKSLLNAFARTDREGLAGIFQKR